jgi:hypothetical protein
MDWKMLFTIIKSVAHVIIEILNGGGKKDGG